MKHGNKRPFKKVGLLENADLQLMTIVRQAYAYPCY